MLRSPPSRRRGLKLYFPAAVNKDILSPPSRRRGLKSLLFTLVNRSLGRLLRGGVD